MSKHVKAVDARDVAAISGAEARAKREASKKVWKRSFVYDVVQSLWWFNALVGGMVVLALVSNWVVKHYAG